MNKEKSIQVLMLISTLIAQIDYKEITKKTSKLRRHIRLSLNNFAEHDQDSYRRCVHAADNAWEYAIRELNNRNYKINIEAPCRALYALLNESPARNIWFSEKTFEKAMQSIYENSDKSYDEYQVENDSNILIDVFADALDIKRNNKLKIMKQTIEMNHILEGKIK